MWCDVRASGRVELRLQQLKKTFLIQLNKQKKLFFYAFLVTSDVVERSPVQVHVLWRKFL